MRDLEFSQKIRNQVQFQPKEPAIRGVSKTRQSVHGFVMLGVFELADFDDGGIDVFHGMLGLLIEFQDEHQDQRGNRRPTIETCYECLVGTGEDRFELTIDRNLGGNPVCLLVDTE